MKPFLATAHQEHLDNLAGYEIALEQEIEAIKADAENEDENVIYAINEYIAYNDEELALHDLAIGSGAFYKLTEVRERAIAYVAKQRLDKRMNEYAPD
ncbi:hypothetical protein BKG91_09810 [Rodentibacter caecimuris]|uniref:Uncharacterized protein n=1 Tax=Rodentibacter pneumotropicus TaxID=758 RepID=A0AAW5LE12_9PAST|nr:MULTISPECIES: hypothetical protein [Pasteurellaceae]AOF53673.1 hypothetical protein AC062_1581 [Pasteurellaceae bacterium NI1060]MCQ9121616.1 hypothetical protein [Rodentibacter pneumotropicus]OOF73124.1 hypothetical protein BKG91_09810 [Rodentibacter heylii]TGY50855.1 hypothetical protein E5343_00450 [Pasteurella caecimuris]